MCATLYYLKFIELKPSGQDFFKVSPSIAMGISSQKSSKAEKIALDAPKKRKGNKIHGKWVGAHVSASGGVEYAVHNAQKIGAGAFALFVKNQRQWTAAPLKAEQVAAFQERCQEVGYQPEQILPHGGYLINPGNPDPAMREKSILSLTDEMERCRLLKLPWLNIHPGSHLNRVSQEQCFDIIADTLNEALQKIDGVGLVLENTAGQGSSVGYRLEQLAAIIDRIKEKDRIGVCIDTCHAFAAGYDITDDRGYTAFWSEFESIIGWHYLKGMHINDAKSTLGSRVDRHHSLGKGNMGVRIFRNIMRDKRLAGIPLVLETIDESLWPQEIAYLRSLERSDTE